MPYANSCRETAFDYRLSQVDSGFAVSTPRHDPVAFFPSMRRLERKNGPIWKPFASMGGEITLFDLLGFVQIMSWNMS